MAKVNTRDELKDYVKRALGYPSINIEATDDQIDDIIDDSIQKFTEYAYGTLEGASVIEISGMGEYDLPEGITNIIKVSKGGTSNITSFASNFGDGYVPNLWSGQFFSGSITGNIVPTIISISSTRAVLEKYFADTINYHFNPYKRKLVIQENYSGALFIAYEYEYKADDTGDAIFNHEWIKDTCKAKTLYLQGRVTGKIEQALIGGAVINHADMRAEATEEITRLNEELLTRWADPAPIDIG